MLPVGGISIQLPLYLSTYREDFKRGLDFWPERWTYIELLHA